MNCRYNLVTIGLAFIIFLIFVIPVNAWILFIDNEGCTTGRSRDYRNTFASGSYESEPLEKINRWEQKMIREHPGHKHRWKCYEEKVKCQSGWFARVIMGDIVNGIAAGYACGKESREMAIRAAKEEMRDRARHVRPRNKRVEVFSGRE